MFLESTPHINLRKANGLINIDYTACDIIGLDQDSSTAAARSYSTIIGVYTRDETGKKIYLEPPEYTAPQPPPNINQGRQQ